MIFARRGQSMLEYTIIVGIVTVVLYYMGTGIKRGMQSLVKVTSDQVGNQQNADQDFNAVDQGGYMSGSYALTQENKSKQASETGYISNITNAAVYTGNTVDSETTYTMANTLTNGGFSPTN